MADLLLIIVAVIIYAIGSIILINAMREVNGIIESCVIGISSIIFVALGIGITFTLAG